MLPLIQVMSNLNFSSLQHASNNRKMLCPFAVEHGGFISACEREDIEHLCQNLCGKLYPHFYVSKECPCDTAWDLDEVTTTRIELTFWRWLSIAKAYKRISQIKPNLSKDTLISMMLSLGFHRQQTRNKPYKKRLLFIPFYHSHTLFNVHTDNSLCTFFGRHLVLKLTDDILTSSYIYWIKKEKEKQNDLSKQAN